MDKIQPLKMITAFWRGARTNAEPSV